MTKFYNFYTIKFSIIFDANISLRTSSLWAQFFMAYMRQA